MKRKIIEIIEEKCNGCGICVESCPEGAIKIIDGKARLVSEIYCDGLGACLKECPQGAIIIEERDAEPYDEMKVIKNIAKKGQNTIKEHLRHLYEHGETKYLKQALEYLKKNKIKIPDYKNKEEKLPCGCPSAFEMEMEMETLNEDTKIKVSSKLENWPIQLHLISPYAPYFKNSNLCIAADCTAFSYGNFHNEILKGKKLIIACPKLDQGIDSYIEKLSLLIKDAKPKTIDIITMVVPCCQGLVEIVKQACGKTKIPITNTVIDINGKILQTEKIS